MVVPAVVLVVLALVVAAAGVLAHAHRLPRNRVLGVRTGWTMSRVDTFRRANRAAAPAFVAAGAVGVVAGGAATASAWGGSTAAAITLVLVGLLGVLVLLGVGGVVGARFAELDEAEERAAAALPGGCCTPDDTADIRDEPEAFATDATDAAGEPCAPAGCGGACSLCPRAAAAPAAGDLPAGGGPVTSPRSPDRP